MTLTNIIVPVPALALTQTPGPGLVVTRALAQVGLVHLGTCAGVTCHVAATVTRVVLLHLDSCTHGLLHARHHGHGGQHGGDLDLRHLPWQARQAGGLGLGTRALASHHLHHVRSE